MRRMTVAVGAGLILILLVHALAAGLGIRDRLMLQPDSAEFIIGARSLVTMNGYRDLSSPFAPRITRPIGTSLLLMPVVAWKGYDISACRSVILVTSLFGICCVFGLSRKLYGSGWGLAVALLVAISPVMISYGSEMISEVPYMALSLLVLVLLVDTGPTITWPRLIGLVLVIILAEKTRSQGLAIWPALLAWGACRSDRKRVVCVVLAGFVCSFLFERIAATGSSSSSRYIPYFQQYYQLHGASGIVLSVIAGLKFYSSVLVAAIMPIEWSDLPGGGWSLPGWLMAVLGIMAGVLAVTGAWQASIQLRRANSELEPPLPGRFPPLGVFVAVYLLSSLFLLSLWPHRMGRLGYPLLPVVAVFVFGGVLSRLRRPIGFIIALGILVVQAAGFAYWEKQVYASRDVETDDWKVAGTWLRENTPPYTRTASTGQALYLHSGRQMWFLFTSTITMGNFNDMLESHGARYARFTSWEKEPIQLRNPVYEFVPVPMELGKFPLWELRPNRTGTVPPEPPDLAEELKELERLLEDKEITADVFDLRRGQLLMMVGRFEEAEQSLAAFLERNPDPSPQVSDTWMQRGDALVQSNRPAEAIDCFRRVLSGYNADFYQEAIKESIAVAEAYDRLLSPSLPAEQRSQSHAGLALGHINLGRWNHGLEEADKAVTLDPENTNARSLRLYVYRRFGDWDRALNEANDIFAIMRNRYPIVSQRRGDEDYRDVYGQVLLIHLMRVLKTAQGEEVVIDGEKLAIDPADPTVYLDAAENLRADGLRGVSLDLLEIAVKRFPEFGPLWDSLGNEYRGFGYFPEALSAWEKAQQLGVTGDLAQRMEQVRDIVESVPLY